MSFLRFATIGGEAKGRKNVGADYSLDFIRQAGLKNVLRSGDTFGDWGIR